MRRRIMKKSVKGSSVKARVGGQAAEEVARAEAEDGDMLRKLAYYE